MARLLRVMFLGSCLLSNSASAEVCSTGNLTRAAALLQSRGAHSANEKRKDALTDSCDDFKPRTSCSSKKRLKNGESGEDAECLAACRAAGHACCTTKPSPVRCYGGDLVVEHRNPKHRATDMCLHSITPTSTTIAVTTTKGQPEKYPADFFPCPFVHVPASGRNDTLYTTVAEQVKQHFHGLSTTAEKQDFAACIVRTAGHDLMDFRYDAQGAASGGSDGCINLEEEDNRGLMACLKGHGYPSIYAKVCESVSLGDFFVIAAEAAMASSVSHEGNGQQRPAVEGPKSSGWEAAFKAKFLFGRPTQTSCEDDVGLMPDPEEGCYDLKRIFVDHVYLDKDKQTSWKNIAALSGVHTLGGAHIENSGYNGTWTSDPWVFNNAYYMRILDQGWMPELSVGGNSKKNMWKVSDETQTAAEQGQMMLNSDLCMIFDNSLDSVNCDRCILNHPNFRRLPWGATKNYVYRFCKNIRGRGHYLNAKEKLCCTWTRPDKMMIGSKWYKASNPVVPLPALYNASRSDNHHCGADFQTGGNAEFGRKCCRKVFDHPSSVAQGRYSSLDFCDYQGNIEGAAWRFVQEFAYDENAWHTAFVDAWKRATTNSMLYVHGEGAAEAATAHFQASYDNCGCCKYKDIAQGDEAFEECENLKREDTYDKNFWQAKAKTWPMWTAAGDEARPDIVSKLKEFLESKSADTAWMTGMGMDSCRI
eukprot:TRINITY_DN11301_c0_g1_i1.p1 TRINITY_DN11301_c0_g1~~TRINITY_DN11301_c0_g1_i1.p1  ORF type:complete len:715 (-),score=142.71 TRINITY_DN11301_c0_g1_i1:265-2373(-)